MRLKGKPMAGKVQISTTAWRRRMEQRNKEDLTVGYQEKGKLSSAVLNVWVLTPWGV